MKNSVNLLFFLVQYLLIIPLYNSRLKEMFLGYPMSFIWWYIIILLTYKLLTLPNVS
jgi:hypothetical protein